MPAKRILLFLIAFLMWLRPVAVAGGAATRERRPAGAKTPATLHSGVKPDSEIAAALRSVSAARIESTVRTLVSFGNRSGLSSTQPASTGKGVTAARDWIKSEFDRMSKECGGCLDVQLDTFTQPVARRVPQPTEMSNVYAILRGSKPEDGDRIVLVTGHYDSRNSDPLNTTDAAPGANDDGSGVAVSLECARVLSKLKFPATIIFLTVTGEEEGLYGSKHFAQMAREKGWKIEAVLNNDIVGGDKSPGRRPQIVRVFSEGVPAAADETQLRRIRASGGENDSPSRELARYISETGKAYLARYSFAPTLIYRRDRYLRGGDHTSFNEEGFAAVRFTEWRENFNHQHQNVRTENGIEYGDLPKFVDFNYVANVVRLNAATLASLAQAPAPPRDVKIETKKLDNNTELVWTSSVRDVAGEILWRTTDASDWNIVPKRQVKSEGDESEGQAERRTVTIDLSKDNVIFAVRAKDLKGHKSLAVVPIPERLPAAE